MHYIYDMFHKITYGRLGSPYQSVWAQCSMRCLGTMSSYKSTMNFRRVVNVLSFLHGWIYVIIKM